MFGFVLTGEGGLQNVAGSALVEMESQRCLRQSDTQGVGGSKLIYEGDISPPSTMISQLKGVDWLQRQN